MTIKEARQAAGLTQAAAAKLCYNVPLRTWEQWEIGRRTPPPYVEQLIIDKLLRSTQDYD